jgi:hypothetical protein
MLKYRNINVCIASQTVEELYYTCTYQSICPFVRIGSTRPLSHKRVCTPPPPGNKGGGCNTRLRVRGRVEPIRTTGEKDLSAYRSYSIHSTVHTISLHGVIHTTSPLNYRHISVCYILYMYSTQRADTQI